MPELPEVETIRRHLAPLVEGRRIDALEISDPRWSTPLAPAELAAAVEGRRVERLGRRGKYFEWRLSDEVFLLMHLRMTGTLLYGAARAHAAHAGAAATSTTGGTCSSSTRAASARASWRSAGRRATPSSRPGSASSRSGEAFTAEHLYALSRGRRAPIKAFLLDQRRVAGVGNIYADEALFAAGIHPLRPAGRLTRAQAGALRDAVVAALEAGIEAKGATIDDFRDPDGVSGSFQDAFRVHLRAGQPCPRLRDAGGQAARGAGGGPTSARAASRKPRRRAQAASS